MKKPIIICIDDEPTVLSSLKRELKAALGNDFAVETAVGGIDALELLDDLMEEGSEIALVISDYIMPDIKGDEVLRRIHEICPKTLKIMLTGQASLEGVTNAINCAQLYRYIAKPWQNEDFNLTIKEALKSYLQDQRLEEQNAQLKENERRLAEFLEAMPVGVSVHDTTGQISYANQKAKELLGIEELPKSKTDRLSRTYQVYRSGTQQLYPTEELPLVRSLSGETVQADDLEIHHPERIIPLEVSSRPIRNTAGCIVFAIAAFQDITERKRAEAEREEFTQELFRLNEAFSRFVPKKFLQLLDKKGIADIEIGDSVQKEMSVLFCDIRSFTTLSEKMTPEENFKFINSYLARMEPAILENHGFIDKFIGDAIMALFGGSADDAIKAAIAMIKNLEEYNITRQSPKRPPIQIGIGINTGSLILGTVGGKYRMDGTVISDAVNLGSRIEQLTKFYCTPLLISHHTFSKLNEPMEYKLRLIDLVRVKGKSQKVAVFEVFDADVPQLRDAKLANKPMFEEGLVWYHSGKIDRAIKNFEECVKSNPWDRVANIYLERCHQSESSKITASVKG